MLNFENQLCLLYDKDLKRTCRNVPNHQKIRKGRTAAKRQLDIWNISWNKTSTTQTKLLGGKWWFWIFFNDLQKLNFDTQDFGGSELTKYTSQWINITWNQYLLIIIHHHWKWIEPTWNIKCKINFFLIGCPSENYYLKRVVLTQNTLVSILTEAKQDTANRMILSLYRYY